MTDLLMFRDIPPDSASLVGGKALGLAELVRARLPVPPGFCLTVQAMGRLHDLSAAITAAYCALGSGPVAVRSSATAEDGTATSFAGQQETLLGVEGEPALLEAITRCWESLDTSRAAAYRERQGLTRQGHSMAVVVQRLVPAEVAGVLFTRDPLSIHDNQMLAEASWGLGESVVSGRVEPDRFVLEHATGQVLRQTVALKVTQWSRGGYAAVPAEKQSISCLDEARLGELAELGRRVEAHFGGPRDVEWAWADGQFWLLQARPITATASNVARETVRREEIAKARALAHRRGTAWGRFNLAEVLPAPTPYTWAVVSRRLMSGRGGFGRMYRDLGYDPHPSLNEAGIFDLIAGRPYCNLSREPMMHDRLVPFEHSFSEMKTDPRRALYPVPRIEPRLLPWYFWLTWPVALPRMWWRFSRGEALRRRLARSFAPRYREEIAPAFLREVEKAGDPAKMDDKALLAHLEWWIARTLEEFSRDSLKPTALAGLLMGELEAKLATVMPSGAAQVLMGSLVMGVKPDPEADLPGAVRALSAGTMLKAEFLSRFGHRGSEEMELARPRWREAPAQLKHLSSLGQNTQHASIEERLAACPNLTAEQRPLLLPDIHTLHDYLALRETAKHHLMHGFALIRAALLEIDRRAALGGGIFFLLPEELPHLIEGGDLSSLIAERRQRRALTLGLEAPQVLFSDDLDAIGRPLPLEGAATLQGVALSAGTVEGPALVLEHPDAAPPPEGYILVCPSTDPAWVPLFVAARALVMETGGVLSHGAIVAREFGLPAVAGLPGITRRIRTGQRLRVDGTRGLVALLD